MLSNIPEHTQRVNIGRAYVDYDLNLADRRWLLLAVCNAHLLYAAGGVLESLRLGTDDSLLCEGGEGSTFGEGNGYQRSWRRLMKTRETPHTYPVGMRIALEIKVRP